MGFSAKIAYVSPGSGMAEDERRRREDILNHIAAEESTVELRQVENGPKSIESAVDEYQALPNILNFVIKYQDQYDAMITGCAGDAGIEGAREQAKIPIVGPGESSLLLGTCGDRRFAMITVSLERAAIKRKLVRDAGLDVHRLVSSHATGIPVLEMRCNPQKAQAVLIECMHQAKAQGADVMILGCMTLAFMPPELLREAESLTELSLVNPVVTAIKMAEALIAMRTY
jgi:allantoin racemase